MKLISIMQVLISGMRERKGFLLAIFWLFWDRVLFKNGNTFVFSGYLKIGFFCPVQYWHGEFHLCCLHEERLISTKHNMKAKMAKKKFPNIYLFLEFFVHIYLFIRINKKHWAAFHFRVWGQEMHVELTRSHLKCKRNRIRQKISRIYFRSTHFAFQIVSWTFKKLYSHTWRQSQRSPIYTAILFAKNLPKLLLFPNPELPLNTRNQTDVGNSSLSFCCTVYKLNIPTSVTLTKTLREKMWNMLTAGPTFVITVRGVLPIR